MISDHDRNLLAIVCDERIIEPAQAALVRRLLAAHDAMDAVVEAARPLVAGLVFRVDDDNSIVLTGASRRPSFKEMH